MVGTISQSAASKTLFNFFAEGFRKSFPKKREFFVGRETLTIWNAGARLTIGALSPPEFDLKRDTAAC
jgi:hypothetical protein